MVSFRREVQESLCGLGRNSRSNLGSRSNSRGNTSNSRVNLLASQTNLGSLSSFHSAVTRQVSQFDFCPFAVFFSTTFNILFTSQGSSIQGDTASLLSFKSTSTAQDSSDTASFYSTGTLQGSRSSSRVESPTSFYSTGTLQGSPSPGSSRVESPSSLSYQSLGSRGSVETLVTSTPTLGLGEEASTVHQVF